MSTLQAHRLALKDVTYGTAGGGLTDFAIAILHPATNSMGVLSLRLSVQGIFNRTPPPCHAIASVRYCMAAATSPNFHICGPFGSPTETTALSVKQNTLFCAYFCASL